MIDPSKLSLFIVAAVALLLVPGPAVLYITARSASQGRAAGLVSVLAIETANLIQAVAAGLGLSAILLSSALAFDVVKYLGAGYLIYLGIRKLRSPEQAADEEIKQDSLHQIYWQGVAVNILNPKTALFFFAFLPQFVDPARGNVIAQNLLLGLIFVALAIVTDSLYALAISAFADQLRGNQRFQTGGRYFAGLVYVALGITTALTGTRK
ncbi:MAG: Homoserine/homoserine lactone efflux protein [Anaerolineales bacterium]|nr:LysE family translocator [Anaerolineae bacterium]MBL8104975.1 LysE family translocator [Anaerolineales bacterium]MBV6400911.1 Homoserine/homoserine lactone efflux protein [Anaerolineales bacterium]MCC7190046.1 LysE family translocator [Anaerolineales bacterium]